MGRFPCALAIFCNVLFKFALVQAPFSRFVFKNAPKHIQRPWALPGLIFEVWPACLAMVISYSSVYSKVHRNLFSGPGPFQASFSRFRPRAWRWPFPIKACRNPYVGLGPFQAPFSRLGSRAWRWSFLIQVCVEKCTDTHLAALGPSKSHVRGLARVLGDGHFLFKLVFKTAPKPI